MIIELGISVEKMTGTVRYNETLKTVEVDFPNKAIQQKIKSYLNKEREFWIPESRQIDDYRIEMALPTDSLMHFELAMSSLWSNTGVMVEWGTEKRWED